MTLHKKSMSNRIFHLINSVEVLRVNVEGL